MSKEKSSSVQPGWSRGQKYLSPWGQSPLDVGTDAKILDDIKIGCHRPIEVKSVLFGNVQSDVMAVGISARVFRLKVN